MSLALRLACGATLFLAAGCSCSEPAPAAGPGAPLDLLARHPDALVEQPDAIVPEGEAPGFVTWGTSEGPGWSKVDLKLPDGTHYRETNQAAAELLLTATDPAERELVAVLWCARPAGSDPARVGLTLNGIELVKEGLVLAREPAEVRVHAPAEAWVRGTNRLELRPRARGARDTWDILALARLSYGAAARATIDLAQRRARFADGTGARYALELASEAELELAGTATGAGVLRVRAGSMDPRTGATEAEAAGATFTAEGGTLRGRLPLALRKGAVRLLDLEWSAPGGAELTLTALVARERRPAARPPIVFVSIDTFAARHLALYGYGRDTSPELARFQRDAVLFERCLANAPWTLPSYLSVLSGLYARSHVVAVEYQPGADVSAHDRWQLAENRWTLAEALRARGYRTAAFIDTLWLGTRYRFQQGFDLFNGEGALGRFEDPHAHIEHIVTRLVPAWLGQRDGSHPPFLFVHALDAHGPYLPDEPFRDTFVRTLTPARTHVPAGSDNQTYRTMPWWMSRTLNPDEKVPEQPTVPLEEVVARYDESLLKVDAYLGKLFALLRERGLYDEAVIVVTGDHGEYFGPGMYGHGLMREAVLHVPLLLKLPGNARAGLRVRRPVALVDVYPTLLELAGVPADPARLHGQSLLARLEGGAAPAERALYSEGGHVEQYALTLGCWRLVEEFPGSESSPSSLLTHPRVPDEWLQAHCPELLTEPLTKVLLDQLLARPGFEQEIAALRRLVAGPYYSLFDLCRDPEEQHDLAAAEPEVLARLCSGLSAEKERSRVAQSLARVSGVTEALSEEHRQALEALGYVGESEKNRHDGK